MTKPSLFDSILGISEAQAHCDVPCGIYDPIVAQIAAQSVVRMIDIINENAEKGIDGTTSHNIARAALVKEEEAERRSRGCCCCCLLLQYYGFWIHCVTSTLKEVGRMIAIEVGVCAVLLLQL